MNIRGKLALMSYKQNINRVIKEGRLKFLPDNQVTYISRDGKEITGDFQKVSDYMVDKSGQLLNLAQVGVDLKDCTKTIEDAYNKSIKQDKQISQQELITKLAELGNRPKGISYANRKIIATLIKQLRKKELPPKQLNKLIKVYEKVEKEYQNNLRKEENKK